MKGELRQNQNEKSKIFFFGTDRSVTTLGLGDRKNPPRVEKIEFFFRDFDPNFEKVA